MNTTRRGFLTILAGGIALASTQGFALIASGSPKARKLKARHLYAFAAYGGAEYNHRIDVFVDGQQYAVDLVSDSPQLTERELEPAMYVLGSHIEHYHPGEYEYDIRSFSVSDIKAANDWWGNPRIGQA